MRLFAICYLLIAICTGAADGATRTAARAATSARTATAAPRTTTQRTVTQTRTATPARAATVRTTSRPRATAARAVALVPTTANLFGSGYGDCRDMYFTCMDQYCANANDSYRRCVCSSRLTEIQNKERALNQTSQQLADFGDLNIDSISKTNAEVKAMLTATDGEVAATNSRDTSASATTLANISEILRKTKSQSLSTSGTLDIAGDIGQIWSTRDFAAGIDLANLTGEQLYNAVHAQCIEMSASACNSSSTTNMVVSAYGMYIENDCAALAGALDKQTTQAKTQIRATEREMNIARLENYDVHNATAINECIAQVRRDITTDTACGANYVHCLDITGKYLSRVDGKPIYTSSFYQLDSQSSLSGDVLANQNNRLLVLELDRKREFAKRGLDTCRDIADDVWDEFMRQAIAEIHQGQQQAIRTVKDECINAVAQCYDAQTQQLKDFSNVKDQLLLGSRMELSEQMCATQLAACSNLYGGGEQGLAQLVRAMQNITDQTIAQNCQTTLAEYARTLCTPLAVDAVHNYPYGCRNYAPGDQIWATNYRCYASTMAPGQGCDDYPGSLFQSLAKYATQTCVRPSDSASDEFVLPTGVLADVNRVMDSVKSEMSRTLGAECAALDGVWIGFPMPADLKKELLNKSFYDQIGANTKWGYCTSTLTNTEAEFSNLCISMGGAWKSLSQMSQAEINAHDAGIGSLEAFYAGRPDDYALQYGWCDTVTSGGGGGSGGDNPDAPYEQLCSDFGGWVCRTRACVCYPQSSYSQGYLDAVADDENAPLLMCIDDDAPACS